MQNLPDNFRLVCIFILALIMMNNNYHIQNKDALLRGILELFIVEQTHAGLQDYDAVLHLMLLEQTIF